MESVGINRVDIRQGCVEGSIATQIEGFDRRIGKNTVFRIYICLRRHFFIRRNMRGS